MLKNIETKLSASNPAVRFFILHGFSSLKEKNDFIVADPNDGTARDKAEAQATAAKIPLAAQLLRMPFFKQVSCMSYQGTDCFALVIKDGENWDRLLGKDATLEIAIRNNIARNLQGIDRLQGNAAKQSDTIKLVTEFVQNHPLQKIVEKDKGTLGVSSLENGNLVLVFGGACSSSSTCVGSQISSRNWISRDVALKFPDTITRVTFITAAPAVA